DLRAARPQAVQRGGVEPREREERGDLVLLACRPRETQRDAQYHCSGRPHFRLACGRVGTPTHPSAPDGARPLRSRPGHGPLTCAPHAPLFPHRMQLILALACDDARVRPDGKLDITGIFNELSAPGFPAAQERMTVVFVIQWDRHESGRMPLRADLVDE